MRIAGKRGRAPVSNKRKIIRMRSGHIEQAKAPYPIEQSWDGTYRQRFTFHNSENQSDIQCDLSPVEMKYWIGVLGEGLRAARRRMLRDCGGSATTPFTDTQNTRYGQRACARP
jgi:hypothetical protein